MTQVTLVKIHKAFGVEAVNLSNGHFVSLGGVCITPGRLAALDTAMWHAQSRRRHFAWRRAIEQFILYKWPIEWTLDDPPTRKDPKMYASNYTVTFTCSAPLSRCPDIDTVVGVLKGALGIQDDSFHDLVLKLRMGKSVRVVINSDQFVRFFTSRRAHFSGKHIRWDNVELVSNPEVITDLSHLR